MAKGQTILENCAKEPHVMDQANFLNMCDANIRGAGTDMFKVRGAEKMHGSTYSIIPDQIEAGSYMVAAAATGGDVPVSYTHLDVYKRQACAAGTIFAAECPAGYCQPTRNLTGRPKRAGTGAETC